MTSSPRVVLVTGAARRLGREIALTLARAGWAVAVHYRSSRAEAEAVVGEIAAAGGSAHALGADLQDAARARALVGEVVQAFGHIDAVVNNASLFEYDDARSFDAAFAARQFATNTAAPVLLAQQLALHLRDGATGCVVNLLDQKLWNPNPDYFSYTLSKAALHAATTLLAQALAPRVRVCGVAPGVTLVSGDYMSDAGFAQAHAMTPLGRSSTPDDVAQAVRYLLDAPAVTGHTLLVDGGQHLAPQPRDVAFLTQGA
ncbi:MAG: SDR family oxidoreductase [Betaproteobacteria bacterium]|nr:SDR family oxidoreductase [Betaproteobacteria bacterium]